MTFCKIISFTPILPENINNYTVLTFKTPNPVILNLSCSVFNLIDNFILIDRYIQYRCVLNVYKNVSI